MQKIASGGPWAPGRAPASGAVRRAPRGDHVFRAAECPVSTLQRCSAMSSCLAPARGRKRSWANSLFVALRFRAGGPISCVSSGAPVFRSSSLQGGKVAFGLGERSPSIETRCAGHEAAGHRSPAAHYYGRDDLRCRSSMIGDVGVDAAEFLRAPRREGLVAAAYLVGMLVLRWLARVPATRVERVVPLDRGAALHRHHRVRHRG